MNEEAECTIIKEEIVVEYLRYVFNDDERRDIAVNLAEKTQELESLEDEKKSVMSTYKDRIDSCSFEVKKAARKYKDGYEMRDIECSVERDYEKGEIRYFRLDNGELARTKKMTVAEKQMRIEDAIPERKEPVEQTQEELKTEAHQNQINREMAQESAVNM